jgi:tetratricopeptide (TPR) repeat protein
MNPHHKPSGNSLKRIKTRARISIFTSATLILSAKIAPALDFKNLRPLFPTTTSANILATADPDNYEQMIRNIKFGLASAQQCLDHYSAERISKSEKSARLLAQRFAEEGDRKRAIEWFNKTIKLNRDRDNLKALAQFYLSENNERAWLRNMERILDLPFDRLDQAKTNHEISRYFIDKGDWEKALPYQEAAAMRGYSWAYRQAAWLNAALGNTERGLELVEQEMAYNKTDSLPTYILAFDAKPTEWSTDLMNRYYEKNSQGNAAFRARCVSIALVREEYDSAATLMEQALAMSNDPWFGVFAALICEGQGWKERRDQVLQDTIDCYPKFKNPSESRRRVRQFIDLYIKANQPNGFNTETKQELDEFFRSCKADHSNFTYAFIGELLRSRGEEERASEIFNETISVYNQNRISEFISFRGLRLLGHDPIRTLNERRVTP